MIVSPDQPGGTNLVSTKPGTVHTDMVVRREHVLHH
jgi:hypothetical protein